jgi:hypothetical protein
MIERKDLVEGKEYFMDNSRKTKGVFKGREDNSIFFDCDENSPYSRSNKKGKEHLTPFKSEGEGFLKVENEVVITDENLELIKELGN